MKSSLETHMYPLCLEVDSKFSTTSFMVFEPRVYVNLANGTRTVPSSPVQVARSFCIYTSDWLDAALANGKECVGPAGSAPKASTRPPASGAWPGLPRSGGNARGSRSEQPFAHAEATA